MNKEELGAADGPRKLSAHDVRKMQESLERIRALDEAVESLARRLEGGGDTKFGAAVRTLFGQNAMFPFPVDEKLGRIAVKGLVDWALGERARIAASIAATVEVRDPPNVRGFFAGIS